MSQANVEIIRRFYELVNAHDADTAVPLFDSDAQWRDLAHAPDTAEALEGVDAIHAAWDLWVEAFDQFGVEVFDYVDIGPWVVCDARWFGEGRSGGVGVDVRQSDAYELRDGRIIRAVLAYPDPSTALREVRDQIVRAAYAQFNIEGPSGLAPWLADDIRLRDHTLPEFPDELCGIDAYLNYLTRLRQSFSSMVYDVRETRAIGDVVLVRCHASAVGNGTGITVAGEMGHALTFDGEKLKRVELFRTWEDTLARY